MDPGLVSWLMSLRGERTCDEALAQGRACGLSPSAMHRLLAAGVRSGLIDDAALIPETLRDAPASVRDMLEGDLASVRQIHGNTALTHALIDRRRRAEVAIDGEGAHAEALALVLTTAGIGRVLRSAPTHSSSRRHRRMADNRACHVLCGAAHPDAAADPDAMALDIPHLNLTVAGTRGVVGPLVIPGRTSCLRCRDLHLADADHQWPRAAVQWSRHRTGSVAAGLAHLTAAWGALQVLDLVDAGAADVQAPTLNAALVIDLPGGVVERQARPAHPLCGCRWPSTGRGVSGHERGSRSRDHGPSAA